MMDEFLKKLWQDLSIRAKTEIQERSEDRVKEGVVLSLSRLSCVYCKGDHLNKDCGQITDLLRRKEVLKKYKRCYQCLHKGHV